MFQAITGESEETAPDRSADGDGLGVLFDVGHPAQVHLFRNAVAELQARGHETFVTSREKEDTVALLDAYGIDHAPLSKRRDSLPLLVAELCTREVRLLSVARRFEPDVVVSRLGPVPAHVSALVGARHVAVSDTHIDRPLLRRVYQSVTLPFVDTLCAPESFELPLDEERRRALDFQELAYLHPRHFEPDPDRLADYGIDPTAPLYVLRMAGWDAYHDVGYTGLTADTARRLVAMLSNHGQVFVSAERDLPPRLAPYRLRIDPEDIHQVLCHANLYVGDSGTMSTEAAMLGTPAIRTNTMVGEDDENVFRELEERYDLLRSYADEDCAFRAVEQLLAYGVDRVDWQERRQRLVEEQPDVTERMVEVILETAATDETRQDQRARKRQ